MAQTTDTDIREIRDLILGLDKKIETLDKKVEIFAARTDERFNSVDEKFNSIDQRFHALETQVADIKKGTDTQLTDIRVQLRSQDNRPMDISNSTVPSSVGIRR